MSIRDKSYNTNYYGVLLNETKSKNTTTSFYSGSGEKIDLTYDNGEIVFKGGFEPEIRGATGSILVDTKQPIGWFISQSINPLGSQKTKSKVSILFYNKADVGDSFSFYGKHRYDVTGSDDPYSNPSYITTFTSVSGSATDSKTFNTGSDSGSLAQNFVDVVNQFNSISGSIFRDGRYGLHMSA